MFLRTDLDSWGRPLCKSVLLLVVMVAVWTWPLALVLALALVVFLMLRNFSQTAAVIGSAAVAVAALVLIVRRRPRTPELTDIWPFASVEDYESALKHPGFLNGSSVPKDAS